MTPLWPGPFGLALLKLDSSVKQLSMPELRTMSCKPESQKQRLERIAVQIASAYSANQGLINAPYAEVAEYSIAQAQELIKQLDALPIDE